MTKSRRCSRASRSSIRCRRTARRPGTCPPLAKRFVWLVIIIAVPVAGFLADTSSQIDQLEELRTKEVKLKEEYLGKKKQAINLDLHRQQLREIDTQFGALLRQLPN